MPKVLRELHKTLTNKKIPLARRAGGAAILALGALIVLWLLSTLFDGALHDLKQSAGERAGQSTVRAPLERKYDSSPGREPAGRAAVADAERGYRGNISGSGTSVPRPPRPEPAPPAGEKAEEYEVREYEALIEARRATEACAAISELKPREGVVFLRAHEHDEGCAYRFKVRTADVGGVLAALDALGPEEIVERTQSIQNYVEDMLTEEEILANELTALERTLQEAEAAYDELLALATSAEDAEAVASVVDSRIALIERMTQKQLSLEARLTRMRQDEARQLDRLEYTFFNVTVLEDRIVDWERVVDSWKGAAAALLYRVNAIFQGVTLGLLGYALVLAQWLLYLFLLILVVKYAWRFGRALWERK